MGAAGTLLLGSALAADDDGDPEPGEEAAPKVCHIPDPALEDYGYAMVEWELDELGEWLVDLDVRAASRPGVEYWVEGRVHFWSLDYTWVDGPWFADPLDTFSVGLEIPAAAYMHAAQADYLSDLVVRLVLVDTETGNELSRKSAPLARLVFDAAAGGALVMDDAWAAVVAPQRAYSDAAQAALSEALPAEDEGVSDGVGPGL